MCFLGNAVYHAVGINASQSRRSVAQIDREGRRYQLLSYMRREASLVGTKAWTGLTPSDVLRAN